MEHLKPDWTINEALHYLADLYPQERKPALDALRLAAREGRVRVTGCPCKWAGFQAIDVGERENIRDLAWVDFTFWVRGGDWAAVWQEGGRHVVTRLPPQTANLLVLGGQRPSADRMPIDSVNPQKAEGWCRLRICRVDVLSAFRKPLEPNVRENLARFALAAGLLPSASAPADKIPPPEAKNDGTLGNWELATANGVPRQQEEPKRPIPNVTLLEHMSLIKQQGGPEPPADKLWKKIRIEFPQFHVTRMDVRTVHKQVWGQLRPGKRS